MPADEAGGGSKGGGGDTTNYALNVSGGLGSFTQQQPRNIVKRGCIDSASRGNSVRRLNAAESRRSLS